MTSTYIVKRNQNIYDVAVQIYGSVEGLFDLLISNEGLSMDSELAEGQELVYHELFIQNKAILDKLTEDGITLANGLAREIPMISLGNLQFIMGVKAKKNVNAVVMKVDGEGPITVDWGDGVFEDNDLIKGNKQTFTHLYTKTETCKMFVSADNSITGLDIRGIEGIIYLQECYDSLVSYAESKDNIEEGGIGLIGNQLKRMTLINKPDFNAMCLEKFDLAYLNLSGASFQGTSIYDYMVSRKNNSATLSGGEIHLTESFLDTATIEVVYDLVNNPDNGEKWIVYIDDTVFKKDGFDYFMNFPLS